VKTKATSITHTSRAFLRKSAGAWRQAFRVALIGVISFLTGELDGRSQGTLAITFEGLPELAPGTGQTTETYSESGMQFRLIGPIPPGGGVVRFASGYSTEPANGSTFLRGGGGTINNLAFSFLDSSVFNLLSVDLAEYTFHTDATTIQFVGYRHDGLIVTNEFITDGVNDGTGPLTDFQIFSFGPEFSSLDRVEIPSHGWSLDNLVVVVPEPGVFALLVLGGAMAGLGFLKPRRQ